MGFPYYVDHGKQNLFRNMRCRKVISDNQIFSNNTENRGEKAKQPASFNHADSERNVNLRSVGESADTDKCAKH